MVKYYVKITDEEPSEDEMAFWFELESGSDEKGEFFALRRNEFNDLVAKFDEVQHSYDEARANFESDVINSYVAPAVTTYMSTLDNVENSTNAIRLKDTVSANKYYTYGTLTTKFDDVKKDYDTKLGKKLDTKNVDSALDTTSKNPVQNKVVSTALNNKADSSKVSSIETQLSGKANSVHNHKTWEKVSFSSNGSIYYNKQLKLCFLTFYQKNVKVKTTGEKVKYTIATDKYKPIVSTKLDCYSQNITALMNASGEFKINYTKTGEQTINVTGFWICKGE